jgi:hypothetical protein
MPNRPIPPTGFRIVEEPEPCPECGSIATMRIQQQRRCNQCGLQWPPVKREPLGPTRRDILLNEANRQIRVQLGGR